MRRILFAVLAGVLVFGAVACGDDDADDLTGASPAASEQADGIYADTSPTPGDAMAGGDKMTDGQKKVSISEFEFRQADLRIAPGIKVVWNNVGQAPHTVTATEGGFDSGNLDPGDDFNFTFSDEGTFKYFCNVHGAERMSGTITVG